MPGPEQTTTTTTCAACGEAAAPAPGAETITHCEWCGAEYPVPADEAAGGPEAAR
jgi:hypothetical protein